MAYTGIERQFCNLGAGPGAKSRQKHNAAIRQCQRPLVVRAAVSSGAKGVMKDAGAFTVQGTVRVRNEDRWDLKVGEGTFQAYAGVFDGHGGYATSEWLANKFAQYLEKEWGAPGTSEQHVTEAFLKADAKVLQPKSGFFGALGERGLGGSKCGATAAIALLYAV